MRTILLVVQKDKPVCSDPEAQIIAEAITAFQYNNSNAYPALIPRHHDSWRYAHLLRDSRYERAEKADAMGQYPTIPINVRKCVVAPAARCLGESTETPKLWQLTLQHFIAFRSLARSLLLFER